ncbi:two-component regulator propeller domain-containing protein [Psychrobium sp. 1_MG-2023]|uniref:ligand-binding sensor domain-containing protein n=1 Tax=Psychrobium sp. 1_MG-2023 TaxID=3062624 RepID=UPI0027362CAD|nr:ligand-binding sensor domain-containing diguanylate cyclase [Psychrobium sp. 1_MG-2023]MDP2561706.1 diguanylate cyclase [Psychrobium sp. 1_MG-2023]
MSNILKHKLLVSFFILILFTLFFANSSVSREISAMERTPLSDYFSEAWNTRDGLPHNTINAISQTPDGYLWIGTWEGLVRFNGQKFKLFTRGSKAQLIDSGIRSLVVENSKLLVAGSRGGVSLRDGSHWQAQPQAAAMVNHAIFDQEGGQWLALEGKGVVFREGGANSKELVLINNVSAYEVAQQKNGLVWVGTNKGLYSIEDKAVVRHFDTLTGLPDAPVYVTFVTREDQLIIGTESGVYLKQGQEFVVLHPELANESITSILEDSHGDIWLGTINHGVLRLSNNTVEKFDADKGLPSNRIFSLFEDSESSIWIGTNGGLFRLRQAPFVTLTSKQGLAGDYIRSVYSHSDGSLWVGSSKGLNKIVGRDVMTINLAGSNKKLSVLSITELADSSLLIGTYTSGVFKYDAATGMLQPYINTSSGLPSNEVRAILEDQQKNIWFGTASGLVRQSPQGNITLFNEQSGIPANFIMALAKDSSGKVWIGTGVGVASYFNGNLQTYHLSEFSDAEYAFGFYVQEQYLWMTTDRGIVRLNLADEKMKALTKKNGLPVDKFFQVIIDDESNLWATSNRGVIKIQPEQVDEAFRSTEYQVDYEFFGEEAGLKSAQANGGSSPAATLHHDGSIWIATSKGVSEVTNHRLKRISSTQLPPVIEQLIVDGSQISLPRADGISHIHQLHSNPSRITLHYAGVGFLMNDSVVYQTKLEGFETQWVEKGTQTFTEFTNLSPGTYTFKIRAKYPNSEWQPRYASLTFNIPPLFWQTPLFKIVIAMLVFIILHLLYRYRMARIVRNETRLQGLVDQQTADLRAQADSFAYQASHDQLTGLYNRRAFDAWCEDSFNNSREHNKPLAAAIIDIDHFKKINDNYSHIIGDKVIQQVAELLEYQCRDKVKLARWGGEEFTLLFEHDIDKAYSLCQTLRLAIEDFDFDHIAKGLKVTISVGLSNNDVADGYDTMIKFADQALYAAKRQGRNRVIHYHPDSID